MDTILPKVEEIEELSNRIDIDKLMDMHLHIKQKVKDFDNTKEIANVWAKNGKFLIERDNTEIAEICYFIANLYDRDNIDYISKLIDCYVDNGHYNYAIDFLNNLYQSTGEKDASIFWNKLVNILPIEPLITTLATTQSNPLEQFIHQLKLDIGDPMTWMCIGYTLKANDKLVLANQALDNALALKFMGS